MTSYHSLFEVIMIVSMGVGVGDSGLTGYEMIQNNCRDEVMMVPSVSVDRKMSVNGNFQHAIPHKG